MRDLTADNRAVSPVIGVILMVAITVILAGVISMFVLDLGQSAEDNTPSVALSVSDAHGAESASTTDKVFRLTVNSVSAIEDLADYEIRVIAESDGSRVTFLGADMVDGTDSATENLEITLNGAAPTTTDELEPGDVFIIQEGGEPSFATSGSNYTVQLVWLGGDKPKVVQQVELRLR